MKRHLLLGLIALAVAAPHYLFHILRGHPDNLLWACNVAAVGVALGLLAGAPSIIGISVLWLAVGLPLWLADVLLGGVFHPTSIFVHAGALIVGLVGLRRTGVRRGTWWRAIVALTLLRMICRQLLPPTDDNINCAMDVWGDHRRFFDSHNLYLAAVTIVLGAAFYVIERALGRWFGEARGNSTAPAADNSTGTLHHGDRSRT